MIEMNEYLYYIVPIVFSFAVIYGSLELASVFKNKNVNIIIALAISFMSLADKSITDMIWKYMPMATIVFIGLFFVGFLWKFINSFKTGNKADYGIIGSILILIFMGFQSPTIRQMLSFGPNSNSILFVVGMILIGIMFIVASRMGMFS